MQGTLKNGDIIHAYAPSSLQLMVINNDPANAAGVRRQAGGHQRTAEDDSVVCCSMLPYLLTIVIFVVIWMVFMNSSQGGAGKAMSFGKSRARMYKSDGKKVTFADVAGAEEEKGELREIVDFLKNPKHYVDLGARIPKGVLLVGPPGTGKTLLAKAVAGEAGCAVFLHFRFGFRGDVRRCWRHPVCAICLSRRRSNSPSIIFIDEIDAVGQPARRRSGRRA